MKKKLVLLAAGLGLVISMNAQWTTPVSITGASFNWQHQVSTGDGSYYLFDVTRNTPRLIIDGPTGNFGIGTSTPASRLHIGCGNNEGILIGNYNDQLGWDGSGGQPGYHIRFAGFRDVVSNYTGARISAFRTNMCCTALAQGMELAFFVSQWAQATGDANLSEAMRITANGNIGIGTANPENGIKLHLKGAENTNAIQLIEASTLNYMAGISLHSSGQRYSICTTRDQTGNFSIFDETHSAHRFTINSDGNIGIGTINPGSYKLNVAGSIRANEIKVNTTGADFVFEPSYKLRPLAEVETFINQHKHLPDVAPAAEMQTNGVSMGEMQAKLLQKVEELTLYSIEQEKKLTEQDKAKVEVKEKADKQELLNTEQAKQITELQVKLAEQAKEIEQLKQLITQKLK